MNTTAELAAELTATRNRQALSQHTLAQRAGLSRATVARAEAGQQISMASLRAIATALGGTLVTSITFDA